MLSYLLFLTVLSILFVAYLKVADYFNIVDRPNERSSHSKVTIRGGGIIFPIAALVDFFFFDFNNLWFILAITIVAGISFIDDLVDLSSRVKIIFHFAAVVILFWQLNIFELPWYIIAFAFLFTAGWINAFNFMDGINGITAIYSFISLATLAWLNQSIGFASQHLIILLILSVIIFSFSNVRKRAKSFAGDVGSISMAFFLAWFIIALIMKSGHIEYILFFAVYGIDTVITILFRLRRFENIFEAHRSHLYQYLSNELKLPHLLVSSLYGTVQLGINIITIELIRHEKMSLPLFFTVLFFLGTIYLIARIKILTVIKKQS